MVDTEIGVGTRVAGVGTGMAWATCGLVTGGISVGTKVVGVGTGMARATWGFAAGATGVGVMPNKFANNDDKEENKAGGCGTCELAAGLTGLASAVPV